ATDSEAPGEDIKRAMESLRSDFATPAWQSHGAEVQPPGAEPEPGDRDEIRRMVEQVKAELAGSKTDLMGAGGFESSALPNGEPRVLPSAVPVVPSKDWTKQPLVSEVQGPPSIIIEDPSGRVDLASIYDTLNRLQCAGEA